MTRSFIKIFLALVLLMGAPHILHGQNGAETLSSTKPVPRADLLYYMDDSTHWMIEIPLWIPGLRGALSYGDIYIDIGGGSPDNEEDGVLKQLFSTVTNLDYFMVGRFNYRWRKLFFDADIYGGRIDNSVTFNYNDLTLLETKMELIISRAYVGYTFIDHPFKDGNAGRLKSHAIVGIQYSHTSLDATLPEPIEAIHVKKSWFDPFLGVGLDYSLYKITLGSSFNMGLNGIGSFDNWWFKTDARYRFRPRVSVELGWMLNGMRTTRTFSDEDLHLKVRLNGPVAGLSFHF